MAMPDGPRVELAPGYTVSKIINGCWQLTPDHGGGPGSEKETLHLFASLVDHGFTTAQSYYDMGRKGSVIKLLTSATGAPLKLLLLKGSWRDGWIGWVAAFSDGIHAAVKHMRLLELQRRGR